MHTYECTDEATGEDFFVEANSEQEALDKAYELFEKPVCFGEIDEELAEMMGYDTY